MQPIKPLVRYPGSKWDIAGWILRFFAPHDHYLLPCGGSAATLLRKPRVKVETYNDLDGGIVNLLRVCRDYDAELIRRIKLTPYSRREYDRCVRQLPYGNEGDPIEWARMYYVVHWQGFGSRAGNGWRRTVRADGRGNAAPEDFTDADRITLAALRLQGVQIENLPALDLIAGMDHAGLQIYIDPPYPAATRSSRDYYPIEWSDDDHKEMAQLLRSCRAHVVISGRPCALYEGEYEAHGWQRYDLPEVRGNSGSSGTESVWLAPHTYKLFIGAATLPLFARKPIKE